MSTEDLGAGIAATVRQIDELTAENVRLRADVRKANARWANQVLNSLLNDKLDDGMPVIEFLKIAEPTLIGHLRDALFGGKQ
ncbi:hypothetical protein O4106_22025 [Rhodococcus pyridinivorans]|uniref:hypothetical protein n=1 Tax=Rhodococcus pyridinivorans TaxID=103816 RepID=UPI0022B33601|nr:hypothetical protein [Rhodococcus pyridinivorans]MCZ4649504.1 hypothetical protein [Rhodococcus pyridinivorans]